MGQQNLEVKQDPEEGQKQPDIICSPPTQQACPCRARCFVRFVLCVVAVGLIWQLGCCLQNSQNVTVVNSLFSVANVTKPRGPQFDYFHLVREWAPTFCSGPGASPEACARIPKAEFTLHGLWPEKSDGTWPQYCNPDYKFNITEISRILDEMKTDWPSLGRLGDLSFWTHEWERHGTCALGVFVDEFEYFDAILQLDLRYNLNDVLDEQGIVASSTKGYSAAMVSNAFKKKFGAAPLLHCSWGKINEIWMCIHKTKLKAIDCPNAAVAENYACPATLKFPEMPSRAA